MRADLYAHCLPQNVAFLLVKENCLAMLMEISFLGECLKIKFGFLVQSLYFLVFIKVIFNSSYLANSSVYF